MKKLFALILFSVSSFGATYTEFYCNASTGANTNAGSTTGAATYSSVNGNWDGTSVFTPVDGSTPASTVSVGMFASVYNDGATDSVYVGRITAVAAGVNGAITVSTTAKMGTAPTSSATGRSITVGGVWRGPNGTSGFPWNTIIGSLTDSSGHSPRINMIDTATYSVTAQISMAANFNLGPVIIEGYTATPGDGGFAILDGGTSGASYNLLNVGASKNVDYRNLIFDHNGATGSTDGVNFTSACSENSINRCVFRNMRGSGVIVSGVNHIYGSEAYGNGLNNTTGKGGIALQSSGIAATYCFSHHNTTANTSGFQLDGGINTLFCIASDNGAAGIRETADVSQTIFGCSVYNNGGAGIDFGGAMGIITDPMLVNVSNCAFFKNGGGGLKISTVSGKYMNGQVRNCLFGAGTMANTGGNYISTSGNDSTGAVFEGIIVTGTVIAPNDVTPWNAPTTGDFRITGSYAKNAGFGQYLQTYTGSTWTGTVAYPDIGAAQHQDSATTGGGSYVWAQ